MSRKIQLTEEQKDALSFMEAGDNVFLTGKAGTGKSTVIEEFQKRNTKSTLYVAPTGIAAVRIGGQTIHSCFQIKPGMMSDLEPLSSKKRYQVLLQTEVVVIDEISMVRSDLLTAVDARLRQVAKPHNHDKPFGGRQIIVVGDFFQLPPIVDNDTQYRYLVMRYGGFYAFQTVAWAAAKFHIVNLQQVHRQKDSAFLKILNGIREGDVDCIKPLQDKVGAELKSTAITLTPYRSVADRINSSKLDDIDAKPKTYRGRVEGKFTKDLPVDLEVTLKVGARVMLAANRYNSEGETVFCNGELGEIVSLGDTYVVVRRDDGSTVRVTEYEWESNEFDYSGSKVKAKKVGSFTQIPIRLAWAVTIHKSQGCTFDNMLLELGRGCFAEGQLYTALSRVRSLDGLALDRKVKTTDVRVSSDIIEFYKNCAQ